ncbi:unnamed protein product [Lepeophtheirus salmonis]|uniref:(salmon louse) hypothetical protein n=1 Tax=Lepeophtheirus salmonis TaxID=72036 RepID=A0A7R8D637_LEPSM|nr:unnamed protein product [Lepeophtheirus salmonis]CAF3013714.1 unnamed protein product [Lepeophtheirus salmonis]
MISNNGISFDIQQLTIVSCSYPFITHRICDISLAKRNTSSRGQVWESITQRKAEEVPGSSSPPSSNSSSTNSSVSSIKSHLEYHNKMCQVLDTVWSEPSSPLIDNRSFF